MAEYIDIDSLGIGKCNPDVFEDKGYAKGWNAAIDIVQNAPAADVRPVVLCKDCDVGVDCYINQILREDCEVEEPFCAYGKRRGADMKPPEEDV